MLNPTIFFILNLGLVFSQIQPIVPNNSLSPFVEPPITPLRRIDDIFTRLPSLKELDEIISSSDSLVILKTVQILASNK